MQLYKIKSPWPRRLFTAVLAYLSTLSLARIISLNGEGTVYFRGNDYGDQRLHHARMRGIVPAARPHTVMVRRQTEKARGTLLSFYGQPSLLPPMYDLWC